MSVITEQRVLKQVTTLPQQNTIHAQWANQVIRDGEVISETYERKAYSSEQKDEFIAEVAGAAGYVAILGW